MSDDFITGLRGDLVEAVERQRRRGRARTAARSLLPRAWRPALAASAVAVTTAAILLGASALSPPPPVRPAIAKVVQLGGLPQDAVLAAGSLWVTDFSGQVIRVDPAGGRVTARIDVVGNPLAIAAGAGGIWVASPGLGDAGAGSLLSRIDPRSGRVVQRIPVSGYVDTVAVGAGGVWLIDKRRPRLERIDPASGKRTAQIPFGRAGAVVAGGDAMLWAVGDDGTVVAVDGSSQAVDRLRGVVSGGHGLTENTLAADAGGAWVVTRGGGEVLHLQAGQVISRVQVTEAVGPLALGDDAVWVASGDVDAPRGTFRLSRVDRSTGEVTGSVDVGRRQPKALVPVGGDVWAISADGTARLVTTRAGD